MNCNSYTFTVVIDKNLPSEIYNSVQNMISGLTTGLIAFVSLYCEQVRDPYIRSYIEPYIDRTVICTTIVMSTITMFAAYLTLIVLMIRNSRNRRNRKAANERAKADEADEVGRVSAYMIFRSRIGDVPDIEKQWRELGFNHQLFYYSLAAKENAKAISDRCEAAYPGHWKN